MRKFEFEAPHGKDFRNGIISLPDFAELEKLAATESTDLPKEVFQLAKRLLERSYLLHQPKSSNLENYLKNIRAAAAEKLMRTDVQEPSPETTTHPLADLFRELSQDALLLVSLIKEDLAKDDLSQEELQADLDESISAAASYNPEKDFRSDDKDRMVREFLDKLKNLTDKLVRYTREKNPNLSDSLLRLLQLPLERVNTFETVRGWIRA